MNNRLNHIKKTTLLLTLFMSSLYAQTTPKNGTTNCLDSIVPNTNGAHFLCHQMLEYKTNEVHIFTKINPTKIDSFDCYRFLLDGEKKDSLVVRLKKSALIINQVPFKGYLKIIVIDSVKNKFWGQDIIAMNSIYIYQFRNGVFEKVDYLQDVDLYSEQYLDRPLKPILYLYPTKTQTINVQINLIHHQFTHTYPSYNNGWEVEAKPDGTLINKATGKEHYCLFWETKGVSMMSSINSGFVIKGNEIATFLEEKLTQLGLNAKETNEFIIYWLPQMENNSYNAIYFANTAYEKISQLNITPKPDNTIRVMMLWQALEKPIDLFPQQLPAIPKREGFTAVEWGGTKVNNFIKNP